MMRSEGVMHLPVHSLLTLQGSILIIYVIYFAPVLLKDMIEGYLSTDKFLKW